MPPMVKARFRRIGVVASPETHEKAKRPKGGNARTAELTIRKPAARPPPICRPPKL